MCGFISIFTIILAFIIIYTEVFISSYGFELLSAVLSTGKTLLSVKGKSNELFFIYLGHVNLFLTFEAQFCQINH